MEIRVSRHINAPVNVTFDVFSDLSKAQERIKGITKLEILSDTKEGMGTRWRETRIMMGREATEEMEISDFQPNQSYDVVASSRGVDYHTRYTFTKQNGGTQVDMVFTGTPTTLLTRLMMPIGYLFKNTTKKALEADMDDLKAVCEAQTGS